MQRAETGEELSGYALSRFNDAKLYCLGMMLYAAKNQNLFPTNLEQTLPYLREANLTPSGTNRFEMLYQGSADKLPSPMTNGIIVLRSQPWQGGEGKIANNKVNCSMSNFHKRILREFSIRSQNALCYAEIP